MSSEPPKWLVADEDVAIIKEIKEVRTSTSKKDPETRRTELVKAISQPLLDHIASQAADLAGSSFGSQFIVEVLVGGIGDKQAALEAVAALATPETEEGQRSVNTPHAGRMFKTLVQGGRFDQAHKRIEPVDPPLQFHHLLYRRLTSADALMSWAAGPNSFAIVAMLEAADFDHKAELQAVLQKNHQALRTLSSDDRAASAGSKILLDNIGNDTQPAGKAKKDPKVTKIK